MNGDLVTLAHGDGGELARRLIQEVFVSCFQETDTPGPLMDASLHAWPGGRLAVTTDSFVIRPAFFPGGNIGKLAVAGTVNDLAVSGAKPLYMTCGFIIEEGFAVDDLKAIVRSMKAEAGKSGVRIVAGDTKVVERGKGDGVFINTTGVGVVPEDRQLNPQAIAEGDSVIVTGTVGDHGIAVLTARGDFGLKNEVPSDCASLASMIEAALTASPGIRIMRDPTRGGLATALIEICEDFGVTIRIEEEAVPVRSDVKGACELLGYDPLYIANEGKAVLIVSKADEQQVLKVLRSHEEGRGAAVIGSVVSAAAGVRGQLQLQTVFGTSRRLHPLTGQMLPRIC